MILELRPVYSNALPKKKSYKKSLVGPGGPGGLEMIFALLTEVVTIHVESSIVHDKVSKNKSDLNVNC